MSILYRGPSINAYYQVSVHFVWLFQWRKLKCEKLTDDKKEGMLRGSLTRALMTEHR
jgi:hypothetical protein